MSRTIFAQRFWWGCEYYFGESQLGWFIFLTTGNVLSEIMDVASLTWNSDTLEKKNLNGGANYTISSSKSTKPLLNKDSTTYPTIPCPFLSIYLHRLLWCLCHTPIQQQYAHHRPCPSFPSLAMNYDDVFMIRIDVEPFDSLATEAPHHFKGWRLVVVNWIFGDGCVESCIIIDSFGTANFAKRSLISVANAGWLNKC